MIEKAKKELKKIEYKYKKHNNKFIRQKQVFKELTLKIDSTSGEEKKLWINARFLYCKKNIY